MKFKEEKMKITVGENERAFLFRNGRFVRMLGTGRHRLFRFLGEEVRRLDVDDEPLNADIPLPVYLRDENFAREVETVRVPDGHVALHFTDGRFTGVLEPGEHTYWKVFRSHDFKLVDTEDETVTLPPQIQEVIPNPLCERVEVDAHEVALLYVDGRFERLLEPGRYFFWRNGRDIDWTPCDLRIRQMDVAGQEILTLDKVALRINFVCTYRVLDPVRLYREQEAPERQLYAALQLALREVVGHLRFDELLERRNDLGSMVLEALPHDGIVEFVSAGLRDVVLPGEIREIMNTVLVAEKKAQASVITRREEVASTRSLLNTAKLMEENATLFKLKELEYLERICEKVGSISLDNASGILEQLRTMTALGGMKPDGR